MKQYRRDAKRHMSDEEYEVYKAKGRKDPKICRGGKPHDYVLVLPFHVTFDPAIYKFNPEEYYRLKDELTALIEKHNEKIVAMGVTSRYRSWERRETRYYICSVCKKQKYDFQD